MRGGGKRFVCALPSIQFVQRLAGLGNGVHGDFGADGGGSQDSVGSYGVVIYWSDEVFAPLFDCATFGVRLLAVNPVKVRLEVAVGAGYVSDFNRKENVATVGGPVESAFNGLVVGQLFGLGLRLWVAAGGRGRGRPRHTC